MNDKHLARRIAIVLLLAASGCGRSGAVESSPLTGRRVQAASMVANAPAPYRVGAYELVFTPEPTPTQQAQRAALLVDLSGGQGHARGFVEWGRPGEPPVVYVVGGWARQRPVAGDVQTVFDLALHRLSARAPSGAPVALRVVVNEASGAVTLTPRR